MTLSEMYKQFARNPDKPPEEMDWLDAYYIDNQLIPYKLGELENDNDINDIYYCGERNNDFILWNN